MKISWNHSHRVFELQVIFLKGFNEFQTCVIWISEPYFINWVIVKVICVKLLSKYYRLIWILQDEIQDDSSIFLVNHDCWNIDVRSCTIITDHNFLINIVFSVINQHNHMCSCWFSVSCFLCESTVSSLDEINSCWEFSPIFLVLFIWESWKSTTSVWVFLKEIDFSCNCVSIWYSTIVSNIFLKHSILF